MSIDSHYEFSKLPKTTQDIGVVAIAYFLALLKMFHTTYVTLTNNIYGVFLPKYLSGMNSGIITSNKRNRLTGNYKNENIIATKYVSVVTTTRLPEIFPVKVCAVLSTNAGFLLA